jgi:hypothetical protein
MDETSNPFRRIREAKGLTQQFIAVRAKVGHYFVLRTEQGLYPNPPPSVMRVYIRELNCDEEEIINEYHDFQLWVRKTNGRSPLGDVPTLNELNAAMHPMKYWRARQNISVVGVCKAFCVAQPVLSHFESKPRLQQSVPKQFLDALRDAGYTSYELELLEASYERHRAFIRIQALNMPPVGDLETPNNDRKPAA